jgi:hypothetical protein
MKLQGIELGNGYRIDRHGKLVPTLRKLSVSAMIRQKKSKKQRVVKGVS